MSCDNHMIHTHHESITSLLPSKRGFPFIFNSIRAGIELRAMTDDH